MSAMIPACSLPAMMTVSRGGKLRSEFERREDSADGLTEPARGSAVPTYLIANHSVSLLALCQQSGTRLQSKGPGRPGPSGALAQSLAAARCRSPLPEARERSPDPRSNSRTSERRQATLAPLAAPIACRDPWGSSLGTGPQRPGGAVRTLWGGGWTTPGGRTCPLTLGGRFG